MGHVEKFQLNQKNPKYIDLKEKDVYPLIELFSKALRDSGYDIVVGYEKNHMYTDALAELFEYGGATREDSIFRQMEVATRPKNPTSDLAEDVEGLELNAKPPSYMARKNSSVSYVGNQVSVSIAKNGIDLTHALYPYLRQSYQDIALDAGHLVMPHGLTRQYNDVSLSYRHAVGWLGMGIKERPSTVGGDSATRMEIILPGILSSPAVNTLFSLMVTYNTLFEKGQKLADVEDEKINLDTAMLNTKFPEIINNLWFRELEKHKDKKFLGELPEDSEFTVPEPQRTNIMVERNRKLKAPLPEKYEGLRELLKEDRVAELLMDVIERHSPEERKGQLALVAKNFCADFHAWAESHNKENPAPPRVH